MSISQRQHVRFSLDIPVWVVNKLGERQRSELQQISIGGCFIGWDENIYVGDEFRMEIELANGNFVPLTCKALYRFDHTGIGVKFADITRFEQELIAGVIAAHLEAEGVPLQVDPFHIPPEFAGQEPMHRVTDARQMRDSLLEKIMATDN